MLTPYRRLLTLRRTRSSLRLGDLRILPQSHVDCLVYERCTDDERLVVALNFSPQPRFTTVPETGTRILLSTLIERSEEIALGELVLAGHEAVIAEPSPSTEPQSMPVQR